MGPSFILGNLFNCLPILLLLLSTPSPESSVPDTETEELKAGPGGPLPVALGTPCKVAGVGGAEWPDARMSPPTHPWDLRPQEAWG